MQLHVRVLKAFGSRQGSKQGANGRLRVAAPGCFLIVQHDSRLAECGN